MKSLPGYRRSACGTTGAIVPGWRRGKEVIRAHTVLGERSESADGFELFDREELFNGKEGFLKMVEELFTKERSLREVVLDEEPEEAVEEEDVEEEAGEKETVEEESGEEEAGEEETVEEVVRFLCVTR